MTVRPRGDRARRRDKGDRLRWMRLRYPNIPPLKKNRIKGYQPMTLFSLFRLTFFRDRFCNQYLCVFTSSFLTRIYSGFLSKIPSFLIYNSTSVSKLNSLRISFGIQIRPSLSISFLTPIFFHKYLRYFRFCLIIGQ